MNKIFIFSNIKMNKKTLTFSNVKLHKKEFHKSKEPIDLFSVDLDQIVVSGRFTHNDKGSKYFIGYQKGGIIKPLCIILPQINGYIKYFENGGKNMSFMIKDDKMVERICLLWLKMIKCGINMIKFEMWLKTK